MTHQNKTSITRSFNNVLLGSLLLTALAGGTTVQAAVVASYDAGITAAGGTSGAADPTGQGWTYNGDGTDFSDGYDSGDGGWRTVDGTSGNGSYYDYSITGADWTALDSDDGWTMTWSLAMDNDAITSTGSTVTDYYVDGNSGNQNALSMIVDRDNEFRYWISHVIGTSNELLLKDEGSGTTYATGVIVDSGFPNFDTFSITYDNDSGVAELDYGAGTAALTSWTSDPNLDQVWMGSVTSGGQGSAIWNSATLESYTTPPPPRPSVIPEPSTMALLLTGSVLFAAGRARHRA